MVRAKASSVTRMCDRELRLIVLDRDRRCQRCLAVAWPDWLETAHFVKRARRRTRWELDNVALLCRDCHRHLDTHPLEKEGWVIARIGETRFRELRRMAEDGQKTDAREVLKRLREMRKEQV